MAITKKQSTVMWVLTFLLAAIFAFAGGTKLVGTQETVEGFAKLGYSTWFRLLIGLIEVVGAVGLLIRNFAAEAGSFLIMIMLGAVVSTVIAGESPIPALVVALMLGGLTYLRAEE